MNEIVNKPLGSGVIMASSDEGFAVTPQTLNDIVEFARFMCLSNAGIPQYLRGNAPDCAAITMQALKWGFDPFSVAQKSYKVKDVLAYEAQLIAAVVNTRSGIKGRLKYAFDGTGGELTCTVTGILDGEEYSYTSPPVSAITTKNSPLWKTDPQQQLGYYSARSWARRYTPEVLLGVYDRDEAEEFRGPDNAKDVTPARPNVMDRLKAAQSATESTQDEREGFSRDFVHADTESAPTGFNHDFGDDEPTLDLSPADDAAPPTASTEGADGEDLPASASSVPSTLARTDRTDLMECARKMFAITVDAELTPEARRGVLVTAKDDWKAYLPEELHDRLRTIFMAADAVIKGNSERSAVLVEIAHWLDCEPQEIGA